MSTFSLFATVTASTKRTPAVSSGKFGAATSSVASLSCTPLDPLTPEIAMRAGLDTPYEGLQTFTEGGLDIVEGDILTVSGKDYPIKAVGDWYWPMSANNYQYIVLELLKNP
jgi:hypothetical protein